jgi:SAM-dependent methyltransferase
LQNLPEAEVGFRSLIERTKRIIGPDRFDRFWYYLVYGSTLWTDSTFNYGYFPADPAVLTDAVGRSQPFQIQMYLEAARTAGDPAVWLTGKRLIELSCGRGGGLSYLNRTFRPSWAVGLDRSRQAIRHATDRDPGCLWVNAPVQNMPFEASSFDTLLCVEALHHYRWSCLDEIRRVLRPGGLCIVADSISRPSERALETIMEWWRPLGFEHLQYRDITAAVANACSADSRRRMELINRLPSFTRKIMLELAGASGSDRYLDFVEGRRTYFIVVGRKPPDASR